LAALKIEETIEFAGKPESVLFKHNPLFLIYQAKPEIFGIVKVIFMYLNFNFKS